MLINNVSRPVSSDGVRNFHLEGLWGGAIAQAKVPSGIQGRSPSRGSGGQSQKLKQFADIVYRSDFDCN